MAPRTSLSPPERLHLRLHRAKSGQQVVNARFGINKESTKAQQAAVAIEKSW
jgi:hypothetical protein